MRWSFVSLFKYISFRLTYERQDFFRFQNGISKGRGEQVDQCRCISYAIALLIRIFRVILKNYLKITLTF